MMHKRFSRPAFLALGPLALLAACAAPYSDPNDPNANARAGAITGALIGGVIGATTDDDELEGGLSGALVGGVLGGMTGNLLDQQAADLRAAMSGSTTVRNTGSELIVTLPQDILFATDSDQLRPDLQRDIQAVAANLMRYPNSTIVVIGHTDNTGEAPYNQALSERRAGAVADVLRFAGVPNRRISVLGQGEDRPVASNLSEQGKRLNRRVEIVIRPNR